MPLHQAQADWCPRPLPTLPREGTGAGEVADTLINSPASVPTPVSPSHPPPPQLGRKGGQRTEAGGWAGALQGEGRGNR